MPLLTSRPYERRRLKRMAARVQGQTVLDIGYAQQPNPFLQDVHRVGLDLGVPQGDLHYDEEIQGDVADMGALLGERRFDTVLLGEFIEHVEQPYDFLRTLRNHIAPGGRLVMSTPNPLGLPVVLAEVLHSRRFFYTQDHVYYFTPRWVERLLERSGYHLEATDGVGLWLPGAVLPTPAVTLSYIVIYEATVA